MSDWLISVPVWGQRYHETFLNKTMPAIRAALEDFPHRVTFVIHTDDTERIELATAGFSSVIKPIPLASTYVALQNAHSDAIHSAEEGDRVALLNADILVSKNLFQACEDHIESGYKAVVTAGVRTILDYTGQPIGAEPRELLEWGWEHRHQIIKDLEWGSGCSQLPTNVFFVEDGSVILRGFHLHPVAILKDRKLPFQSTIDGDLLEYYKREEIYVVTDPDDLAMIEMSERGKRFPVGPPLHPERIARSMNSRASALHRWLFSDHRIVVVGNAGGVEDIMVASMVMELMKKMPIPGKRR